MRLFKLLCTLSTVFLLSGHVAISQQIFPSAAGTLAQGGIEISFAFGLAFEIKNENESILLSPATLSLTPDIVLNSLSPHLSLQVYPNPVVDRIQLVFAGKNAGTTKYFLMDLQGKILNESTINLPKDEIDLQYLKSGTYLLIFPEQVKPLFIRIVKL